MDGRFSLANPGLQLEGFVPGPPELHRLHTIYYDSSDVRLARWGASLRFRHAEGWTLKLPVPEYVFPGGPETVPADALALATAFLRGASVAPVTEILTLRVTRAVSADGGREVARIVEDDVRVIVGTDLVHRFGQLEIARTAGVPDDAIDRLTAAMRAAGAQSIDAAAEAVGLEPRTDLPPIAVPAIRDDPQAGELFRVAFAAAAERIFRADAALRRPSGDPEPLHQARVAVRRLRSHLRMFGPILDRAWAAELAERLRWWGDALGAARDADVLAHALRERAATLPAGDRAPADALLATFAQGQAAAYARVADDLRDPRYVPLLDAILDGAERPVFSPLAFAPAADVIPTLLAASWRSLRRAVRRRSRPPTDVELHRIRIRAKRVRYVAEAVAPAAGRAALRFARRVEALQSVLGEQHDAVVAYATLRERAADGTHAFAAGELAALALAAADEGRRTWRAAWRDALHHRFW